MLYSFFHWFTVEIERIIMEDVNPIMNITIKNTVYVFSGLGLNS